MQQSSLLRSGPPSLLLLSLRHLANFRPSFNIGRFRSTGAAETWSSVPWTLLTLTSGVEERGSEDEKGTRRIKSSQVRINLELASSALALRHDCRRHRTSWRSDGSEAWQREKCRRNEVLSSRRPRLSARRRTTRIRPSSQYARAISFSAPFGRNSSLHLFSGTPALTNSLWTAGESSWARSIRPLLLRSTPTSPPPFVQSF